MRSLVPHRSKLFCAAIALMIGAQDVGVARAPLSSASEVATDATPPTLPWRELAAHPERHLGELVRVRVQFQSQVASWNPYVTRFGTQDFAAIQAWTDEQFPWLVSDFEAPRVRLFVRRETACAWAIGSARTYARYELVVRVREVFLSEPWCEIEQVVPLAEQISEGTLIHAGRALECAGAESWELADAEFEQALAGNLPPQARAELERLRAQIPRKSLR